MKDYYRILGVNRDASQEDIKRSFRSLALRYHPDRNPQNTREAEAQFKEINEAYEVLGDEHRRWRYDYLTEAEQYRMDFSFNGLAGRGWGCRRGFGRRCRRWESIDEQPSYFDR